MPSEINYELYCRMQVPSAALKKNLTSVNLMHVEASGNEIVPEMDFHKSEIFSSFVQFDAPYTANHVGYSSENMQAVHTHASVNFRNELSSIQNLDVEKKKNVEPRNKNVART